MAKVDDSKLNQIVELVERKEKEWKEAQELRVKSMELSLKEHEKLLNNERIRFRKLKEDFEYNLKLLAERDQELERYDLLFSKYKSLESERDGEVSDLKIKLDDMKSRLLQEENSREELQKYYQQRLKEHQQEMQQFVIAKESEVKKERDSLEKFKRDLQQHLRSAEEDMERQRQILMAGYDDELHKREHEYRLRADEMSNKLLESDLKVKMLSKEVEILRSYEERTKTDLHATETNVQELEKKLKQKEWELIDNENMHNAKIADVELELEKMKAATKKSQGIFQHKQAELDRYAREKESTLLASKEAHQQREQTIRELQTKLDTVEVDCRRLEWESRDVEKDKQFQLEKFQKKVADLEEKLTVQSTKFSRSSVAKDLELEALRQQEDKLRMDVAQRTADLERYKKDLAMATERESNQERIKAQLELDWQRRCEDAERDAYERQEELIRHLTKTKEEAVATVKEKERELDQRENLVRILTQTRDQALATLQRHGLSVPMELPSKEDPWYEFEDSENLSNEEKIKIYQEQNQSLRDVIRQMRQEMEELNNQLASRPPSVMVPANDEDLDHSSVPLTSEYVKSLEKEIRDLKAKNRSLNKRLEDLPLTHKPPTGTGNEIKQARTLGKIDDPFVQSHVKELNDTIGVLRQDKLQLAAEARKHEATIAHLRSLLNQVQDEARQKQVTVDQTQYELNALTRRSVEECSALKQRVSELELLLTQVRREADEYFKTGLERNLEATTLGNQLSVLKLELASQGKATSSFHPQNSLITQLQDEVQRLRSQLNYGSNAVSKPPSDPSVARLKSKLKTAAERITQLVREKEQLIQMGNKLRAELARQKGGYSTPDTTDPNPRKPTTPIPVKVTPNEITDQLQTKLSAMEKLQYALTAHELQVAQRMTEQQKTAAVQVEVNVRSSSSESSPSDSNDVRAPEKEYLHGHRKESSNNTRQEKPYTKRPESAVSLGQRRSSSPDHALFTSSSEGHASIQEIWKLLEEEESFRSLSPIKERPRSKTPDDIPVREESGESSGFTVKGKKTLIDFKSQNKKPELSKKARGKMKFTPKKAGIRNYNLRDDTT